MSSMPPPTDDYAGFVPWVLAGIGVIVSTLLTGVVSLFRMRETENAKQLDEHKSKIALLEIKSEKCEEQRAELNTKCEVNAQKITYLTTEVSKLTEVISKIDRDGTKYSHDHIAGNK